MTPQPAPPAQQSWFSKNWPWVAGGGCLLLVCCGVFSLFAAGGLAAYFETKNAGTDPIPSGPGTPRPSGTNAARVDCGTPGPNGVDCVVKRTGGSSGLEACWTLEIECANGGKMSGEACGSLSIEDSVTVNMPVEGFSNQDACDAPKQGTVKNLVVTNE